MAGIVVDEGLPTAAGFAFGQRLVEGSLRIFRRADVGLLGDRVALAGAIACVAMSDDTPMLAAPSAVRRVIEWTAIASSCLFSPSLRQAVLLQ